MFLQRCWHSFSKAKQYRDQLELSWQENDELKDQLREIKTKGLSDIAVVMDFFRASKKRELMAKEKSLGNKTQISIRSEAEILINAYSKNKELFNLIQLITRSKDFWEIVDIQTLKGRNKGENETYINRIDDLREMLFGISRELN